jgi:class 3 adenylate cyclase/tetratricopeptide (TPR) repeat protein
MKCPKCEFDNRDGAKFCKKCGEKLELLCPSCNYPYHPGSTFCDECGHNLQAPAKPPNYSEPHSYTPKFLADKILTSRSSIEGERKLVTVLFADVANFTSISEKLDPEEVHQIMDGCFKILMDEIHKFEGTINQFTGDGVMALFGAPVAHEDHAVRACYAALSIQKALEKYAEKLKTARGIDFKMRIGLNSGPVIVGAIGDDLRMDYTAVGDTTNLAARMESSAEPGTVLASKNTYKIVADFFQFEPIEKFQVKGKEALQEAFKLIRKSDVETRIAASAAKGLTRFVGRENTLAALMEAYHKAVSGSGQVVGMVGEAGVGKSRSLLEFRNQLPPDQFSFLEGRCLHYGSAMAYLPFLDILKSYLKIADDDSESLIKKKIKDKTLTLDPNLQSVINPFQDMLSLKVDDEKYLQVDPAERKIRVFESLRNLFVRESQNKPLIIAIEDLHWIDKISQEFIGYFIDSIQNTKILLILLYRPEYNHQWGSKSHYTKVGVTQLGTKSSSRLVQAILEEGEVAQDLRDLILKRAGGNPLFVEELTHNLLENGSIEKRDHQYVLTKKASDIAVPDTLQGIIAARIDRVEESLKRVMQMASVIGREFAFRILESIMGMREGLKSSLLNLQGLEFISEKQLFPELEYIFKHALTQEVAYNSLLQKRKKEIHEKVAQSIEALYPARIEEYYELLAYHYRRSDNVEKALDYLDKANQKAARLNAMQEALNYFNEAMKLLDVLDATVGNKKRRTSLLSNQTLVFLSFLKIQDYNDLLTQYLSLVVSLEDNELSSRFYSALGFSEYFLGHFDQTIKIGTKAIELSKAIGHPEHSYYAYIMLLWSYVWTCDYNKFHSLKEEVLSSLVKKFELQLYVHTFITSSLAINNKGQFDDALHDANKALKMAEKYPNDTLICLSFIAFAWVYVLKGDNANASKYIKRAFNIAKTPRDTILARSCYAWVLCHSGDAREGTVILVECVQVCQAANYNTGLICASHFLGEGYLFAGDYDKALQTLKNLAEFTEQRNIRFYFAVAQYLLGEVTLKTDPSNAPQYFTKSIDLLQAIKAEYYLARAYAGYGRYHKQKGDMAQARDYLTKALEIFTRLEVLHEPDKVKKELADMQV